jgi:hypothetical protein
MRASEKQKPRWFWTGAMPLDGMEDDSGLRELVAMLPARKSTDREILTYLVDLRARFLGGCIKMNLVPIAENRRPRFAP